MYTHTHTHTHPHIYSCPGSSAGKESICNAGDPSLIPGSGRSPGEGIGTHSVFLGFPGGSAGKEFPCNAPHLGSIPGLGRSLGEGNSLENPMDCIVPGVTNSRTRPSNCHFHTHTHTHTKLSRSVMSDSLQPHGLSPERLLCPWDFPGKNTGKYKQKDPNWESFH